MTFPPPPLPDPEWRALSTLSPLNGHIESGWNQATGQWSNPEFIQDPYLRVHGLAPVFHYGQEAYEGMKAFRTPDDRNIHIFRPSFHARRLNDSNLLVSIPPVPEAHFLNCVSLAVALNAEFVPSNSIDGMLYIRPVVFGSGPRILLSPTDEYIFCVYVVCAPAAYHGVRPLDALILEDFDRAAPRGVGGGKVGGNYAPVMRWSEQARKEGGWGITLHLDSQTHTHVEEFSTSGFVGVKGRGADVTIVVPDTKNAIRSVTVDSIQTIARQLGWNVECRPIKYEELRDFSEVLACGTAVVVVSVKSVTRKSTGDRFLYQDGRGEPGPVATKLANVLRSIQKGREEDSFGWCARVEGPVELPLGSTRE